MDVDVKSLDEVHGAFILVSPTIVELETCQDRMSTVCRHRNPHFHFEFPFDICPPLTIGSKKFGVKRV